MSFKFLCVFLLLIFFAACSKQASAPSGEASSITSNQIVNDELSKVAQELNAAESSYALDSEEIKLLEEEELLEGEDKELLAKLAN